MRATPQSQKQELGFAVKLDKPREEGINLGREALRRRQDPGCASVWCNSSSNTLTPLLYHNEPIWQGDSLPGFIHPAYYAHSQGGRGPWAWAT